MRIDPKDETRFQMHPSMKISYVSINVYDIDKSVDFYKSILGFKAINKSTDKHELLSVDGSSSHLVELSRVDEKQDSARRAGLYHFAVLLPERKFLGGMLQHLRENRGSVQFDGLADHLVSESIYIKDPDLNGIEIYSDRPRTEWKWTGGQVEMASIRLDTENLLGEATVWKGMPAKTVIGHMHLHVSDLAKARRFYSDILGLNLTTTYPGAYFFAADGYHHHIATNTWLGTGIGLASPKEAGLDHFGIELPNRAEFEKTVEHLSRQGVDVTVQEGQGAPSATLHDSDDITMILHCC